MEEVHQLHPRERKHILHLSISSGPGVSQAGQPQSFRGENPRPPEMQVGRWMLGAKAGYAEVSAPSYSSTSPRAGETGHGGRTGSLTCWHDKVTALHWQEGVRKGQKPNAAGVQYEELRQDTSLPVHPRIGNACVWLSQRLGARPLPPAGAAALDSGSPVHFSWDLPRRGSRWSRALSCLSDLLSPAVLSGLLRRALVSWVLLSFGWRVAVTKQVLQHASGKGHPPSPALSNPGTAEGILPFEGLGRQSPGEVRVRQQELPCSGRVAGSSAGVVTGCHKPCGAVLAEAWHACQPAPSPPSPSLLTAELLRAAALPDPRPQRQRLSGRGIRPPLQGGRVGVRHVPKHTRVKLGTRSARQLPPEELSLNEEWL